MGLPFFGQFLVDRGFVSQQDLAAALERTDPARLGLLAVSKGILTGEELARLARRFGGRVDVGSKALKAGMMSEDQRDYLVRLQKNDRVYLSDCLTEAGVMSPEALQQATGEFEELKARYAVGQRSIPASFAGRTDAVALLGMTEIMLAEVMGIVTQLGVAQEHVGAPTHTEYVSAVAISGDYVGHYILAVDARLAAHFGRVMLSATSTILAPDPQALRDVLGEFINIVVGAATGALAQRGHEIFFGPPASLHASEEPFELTTLRCLIVTPFGSGEVLLT